MPIYALMMSSKTIGRVKKDNFAGRLIQVKVHNDMKTMSQLAVGTSCKRRHREQSCYLTNLVPETYCNTSQTLACQTCQPDLC